MSTFNDREKGFEAKFRHDQETMFKIEARRNKLLGLWAAELLGREDKDAYAREVIESDFEEAGDEDVYRKLWGDLQAANVALTGQQLRQKMDEMLAEAHRQITGKGLDEV